MGTGEVFGLACSQNLVWYNPFMMLRIISISLLLGLITEFLVKFILPIFSNSASSHLGFLTIFILMLLPIIVTSITVLILTLKYSVKYPLVVIGLSQFAIYVIDSFNGPDKATDDACFNLNLIELKTNYLSCAFTTLISQSVFFLLPFLVITFLIFFFVKKQSSILSASKFTK